MFHQYQVFNQYKTTFLLGLIALSFVQQVSAADWLYTMRPGDTLWTLCKEYTKEPNCWQKLGPLNKIDRDRAIPPGTRIRVPAHWLKVPAASAEIIFIQGDVKYQTPDEALIPAAEGVKLTIGSTLVTGKGTVSVLFADGSSLVLEPNSQLKLDALSNFELNGMVDSTIRLKRGTVKTRVIKREPRSRFQTITPSAVAAVRGTEYRVNVGTGKQANDTPQTRVEVYQGLVDVGAEDIKFPVPASFGIVAKQGEALQAPVKLLDKPTFINLDEQQLLTLEPSGKAFLPHLIHWQNLELASAYQLNILADDATKSEKLLKSYRTIDTKVNVSDLGVGCYQLSLRAIDVLGLHGLAAKQRLCLKQQLSSPFVKSRQLNSDTETQLIQLYWDKSSDAQSYLIEVSETPDFSAVISSTDISSTQFNIAQTNSDLYVRVKALNENNHSNYSQSTFIQAKEVILEEDNTWEMIITIGLLVLAFL